MRVTVRFPAVLLAVTVLVSTLVVKTVLGYSTGAVQAACGSMLPNHGHTPQSSQPPFQITPDGVTVDAGDRIRVTLATASTAGKFKGFLIQARDVNTSLPLGKFITSEHKFLSCATGVNNAVTHGNSVLKDKVVVDWEAPADLDDVEVVFRATAVESHQVFWLGITSEKVSVVKRSIPSTADPTSATSATTAAATSAATAPNTPVRVQDSFNAGDTVISVVNPPPSPSDNSIPVGVAQVDSDASASSSFTGGVVAGEVNPTTAAGDKSLSNNSPSVAVTQTPSAGNTRREGSGILRGFRGRTTAAPAPTAAATTEATTPRRVLIADLLPGQSSLAGAIDSIYLGCDVNKGCFGYPDGCIGKDNCEALVTYSKTGEGYQFELMGTIDAGTQNAYVAGALSFDDNMGTDSVMACRSYNGIVDINMAWNEGRTTHFLVDDKQGLSNYEMVQVDGRLYCRFIRSSNMEIQNNVFNLDQDKFHILVSKGPLAADGSLSYHTGAKRLASATATSISVFKSLAGSGDLFLQLHASFMVIAWVGTASSGILIARYYKQTWRAYKCCNIDQWFHFHRIFMGTTWTLTMSALVLIVLHVGGWTSVPASHNPHAYIGIVAISLCFIQPFMALFRCAPTHKRRPWFNWIHWFVGNAAQVLGITAIFYGLELYDMPSWTWWIMIVFVGFHCLIHLLLSIGECVSDSRSKNQVSGIPMKEFNSSRDMLQPQQDKVLDAPGAVFRKAMLGLYLFVVWLLVVLMVVVIIVGKDTLDDWNLDVWEKEDE